tara:strand:- start:150 stop:422 length:273 start_codon:yes stop_codon:yes gene_type:complete
VIKWKIKIDAMYVDIICLLIGKPTNLNAVIVEEFGMSDYQKELKILNRIIEATHNNEEELINKVHDVLFGQDKNQTKLESYGFEFKGEEE